MTEINSERATSSADIMYLAGIMESTLRSLRLADPLADVRVYPLDIVAETVNISLRSLTNHCRAGTVPGTKHGRRLGMNRVQMAELNEMHKWAGIRRETMTDVEAAIEMTRTSVRRYGGRSR